MHYEISCFIRSPSLTTPISDEQIKQCVERLETLLARTDAQFTIELRDLKRGVRLHHSVRLGADHRDLSKGRQTFTQLQSQSLAVAEATWSVSVWSRRYHRSIR